MELNIDDWGAMRRMHRWVAGAAVVSVVAGGGAAYAAVTLHGQAELVSQPIVQAGLAVNAARLEPALTPGDTSALVFTVRNTSGLTVVADRVTLKLPLRDAKPAGCTSRVSGPLLARRGLPLTGGERVLLGPGQNADVTVPGALSLASSATRGCGFRVTLDVQAVPGGGAPATSPIKGKPPTGSTVDPTQPVATPPTPVAPGIPTTATTAPTTAGTVTPPPPATGFTPPTTYSGGDDCDPADTSCSAGT